MPTITSKDGTSIAYDKVGKGPTIILVNGALAYRGLNGEKTLGSMLAGHFTVIFYDRRGRGDTKETKPYSVEREIEDIEALINEAGGKAFLYGASSGAALALQATNKLGSEKVKKLVLYEPPYDAYVSDGKNKFAEIKNAIKELVAQEKPGDAIAFFFESIGTPAEILQAIRQSADWHLMEKIGHTLIYDFDILGDGLTPLTLAKQITIPTIVLDGEKSYDFMHRTAVTLGKTISGARHKTLKDQTHQVSPEAIFPVLADFFSES